jgi:hypothetical protein
LQLARHYGFEIARAILWELSKEAALASGAARAARLLEAKPTLQSITPVLNDTEATAICRRSLKAPRATNYDVGVAIAFTWDEYLALRKSGLGGKVRQIWPADISAEEFVPRRDALWRDEDTAPKTAKRLAAGRRNRSRRKCRSY